MGQDRIDAAFDEQIKAALDSRNIALSIALKQQKYAALRAQTSNEGNETK